MARLRGVAGAFGPNRAARNLRHHRDSRRGNDAGSAKARFTLGRPEKIRKFVPKHCGIKLNASQRASRIAVASIGHLQRESDRPILPLAPLERMIRQITETVIAEWCETPKSAPKPRPMRFQRSAFEALRVAAEHAMVSFFEASNLAALHSKRVTLQVRDADLAFRITRILAPLLSTVVAWQDMPANEKGLAMGLDKEKRAAVSLQLEKHRMHRDMRMTGFIPHTEKSIAALRKSGFQTSDLTDRDTNYDIKQLGMYHQARNMHANVPGVAPRWP